MWQKSVLGTGAHALATGVRLMQLDVGIGARDMLFLQLWPIRLVHIPMAHGPMGMLVITWRLHLAN